MKVKTVDERMRELKDRLPLLDTTTMAAIKDWLINDRNDVTKGRAHRNFKNFNNIAKF